MRGIAHFIGANLFLLAMLVAGLVVVVMLSKAAEFAGAGPDVMVWLYWPTGIAGVVATYYAGKFGHRAISKLL